MKKKLFLAALLAAVLCLSGCNRNRIHLNLNLDYVNHYGGDDYIHAETMYLRDLGTQEEALTYTIFSSKPSKTSFLLWRIFLSQRSLTPSCTDLSPGTALPTTVPAASAITVTCAGSTVMRM